MPEEGFSADILSQYYVELAREHLREGRSFAWNATSVSRTVCDAGVRLFAAYRARIRIVYVEVPVSRLLEQNRERARPVPEKVMERLLNRWEDSDRTEAHQVDWLVSP